MGDVLRYGGLKFYEDQCFGKASSLAYVTVLSLVPSMILMFSIFSSMESTRGVVVETIESKVLEYFFPNEWEESEGGKSLLAKYLAEFTKNITTVSILGLVWLLVAAVDIIFILEVVINEIWKVRKGRGFLKNIVIYWAMITLLPMALILSLYIGYEYSGGWFFEEDIFSFLVVWGIFFLINKFLPRWKVKVRSALIGGLVSGVLWELGKWGFEVYMNEIGKETLGKIYGGLYIVPIFIAWVYFCYVILLYGMQISYILENWGLKEAGYKKVDRGQYLLCYIMNALDRVYRSFDGGYGGVSLKELSGFNGLPMMEMREILRKLVERGILGEVEIKGKKGKKGKGGYEYCVVLPKDRLMLGNFLDFIFDESQYYICGEVRVLFDRLMRDISWVKGVMYEKIWEGKSYKDLEDETKRG